MKKASLVVTLVLFQAMAMMVPAFAAGKEVTITGQGMCAKCALHESDKCQNTIQTEENGKKVTYYLTQNAVSKDFHDNICKESKKISATGKVKEVNGKKVLTPSKIEVAK